MDYDIQQQEKRLSKENRIVTVDTRPLIIREMNTTDTLEIPSNIVIVKMLCHFQMRSVVKVLFQRLYLIYFLNDIQLLLRIIMNHECGNIASVIMQFVYQKLNKYKFKGGLKIMNETMESLGAQNTICPGANYLFLNFVCWDSLGLLIYST